MITVKKQRELFERNAWQYKNVEKLGFKEFLYKAVAQVLYGNKIKQNLSLQQINRSEYTLVKFLFDNYEFRWCNLNKKTLAQRMKVSRWTLYTAVAHLQKIGVIEIEKDIPSKRGNEIIGIKLVQKY